tara:strand:+ start:3476 stop:5677 length:2202 start_codon:yes stop_codon:yes gene_type:complete
MAENGILDYQGMNQAIYRGATSNIVVDTQSMSIEIGTGNTSHTSNLHFECNHDANVASIKLNSNVTTEFSRSKKIIKYPRVAMTSGQSGLGAGYTQNDYNIQVSTEWDSPSLTYAATYAVDNTFNNLGWLSGRDTYNSDGTAENASSPDIFQNIKGSWINIQLPDKIVLDHFTIIHREASTLRNADSGILWAKNKTDSTWFRLHDFSDLNTGSVVTNTIHINQTIAYDEYRLQITKVEPYNGTVAVNIGEWQLFGVPEYDPDADGVDVVVKSIPNVPNTDWLEVYYDAKDLADEAISTTAGAITGLGGTTNNGTAYGGVTVSDGAFVLDGTNDYIITAPIGFTGDQVHSVSLWFWSDRPQTDMTTENGIYGIGYANNLRAGLSWWSPVTQPNSSLRFWHSGSGGRNFPGTTFLEGKWNHVVVVYPGDGADNIRIWLNGAELTGVQNTSVNSDFNWSASDTIVIGDWYTGTGVRGQSPWDGKIANFRLFNRVITSDEIYQLYAYQKEYFGHSTNNMTLKAGRLGIGTSEPRAALDVRGRIAREYNPGEIIEELNAICDGSTVMVQSGSYTMANITAYQAGTTSHQVITGSTLNYTPPPGTKRVYYRFWFHWDAYRNSGISHFQFQIDNVLVTPSKSTVASNYSTDTGGNGHHHATWPISVEYTIDCNASTDDASNGKFKSWTGPKELECTFRNYNHTGGDDGEGYKVLLHVNEWTDGTGTDSIKKPHLTIRAIA